MSSPDSQAPVWVVAGAPGAGKSTVADLLLASLDPTPALLDKDVLFAGFVAEVQRAHGHDPGEREGEWYDVHVKAHEYAGMTAAAAQIRQVGCPVMLVGPFTQQIREARHWAAWVQALGGDPIHLVWVGCAADVLHGRLLARGRPGDSGKLSDWDAFLARMQPATEPPVAHWAIDNSGDQAALSAQLSPDRIRCLLDPSSR